MIRLDGLLKTLEIVLGDSVLVSELDVVCSFGKVTFLGPDFANLTDMGLTAQNTTGSAPITIAGPGAEASDVIGVESFSVYNPDVAAVEVYVQVNDGSGPWIIRRETLQPGESLLYDNGTWTVASGATTEEDNQATAIGEHAIGEEAIGGDS